MCELSCITKVGSICSLSHHASLALLDARLCYAAHRMKISQARLGQKHSQQTIEKMRISQAQWWERQKAQEEQAMQQDAKAGLEQGKESMGNFSTK